MKILFVNATHSWGGIKSWMLRLGEFLQQRGHKVLFCCLKGDELVYRCNRSGLACFPITFGPDYSPVAILRFWKLIKKEKIDLLVTNTSKEIRTAAIAARIAGIAHVNRLGLYGDIRDRFRVKQEYRLLVDKVIVPSWGLYDHLHRYDFMKGKLKVLRNCVKSYPLEEKNNHTVKFAIVAVLSARKQVDQVLKAFAKLPGKLKWELHIGGFGPELNRLKKTCSNLFLDQRVVFHGPISNPYGFLKDKDAGILYSTSEGAPNSLLEYMALSLAVIASDIEGVNDIIENEHDGLLVDPRNTAHLTHAIRKLIENPSLRYQLAVAAHRKIQSDYTIEKGYGEIEEELQRTIATKRVHLNQKSSFEVNYAKHQQDTSW